MIFFPPDLLGSPGSQCPEPLSPLPSLFTSLSSKGRLKIKQQLNISMQAAISWGWQPVVFFLVSFPGC